jgi:hypothetical protein
MRTDGVDIPSFLTELWRQPYRLRGLLAVPGPVVGPLRFSAVHRFIPSPRRRHAACFGYRPTAAEAASTI